MTELDQADSLAFQRRAWACERLGWMAMALFLVLAATGAFGRGPLSRARVQSADQKLTVEHERIVRRHAPCELRLMISPPVPGPCVVRLPRAYVDQSGIEQVMPPAESIRSGGDELLYGFQSADGNKPFVVQMRMSMRTAGIVEGLIRVGDSVARVRHVVLP